MRGKQRLDLALVDRSLAVSRQQAQAIILSGNVTVDGQRVDKPGHSVTPASRIEVREQPRYVSRGGLKLEAALKAFGIAVSGAVCLDVGTSTGGFTDCLLQHGAVRVHAVDTGAGQIDWRLRNDPRVILHERYNARHLRAEDIDELVDIITCDVSFISVTLILPALIPVLKCSGELIILVKPQFEAGRELVGSGGIVRDTAAQQAACDRVNAAVKSFGFETALMQSPITGAEGNREFLLHAGNRAVESRQG